MQRETKPRRQAPVESDCGTQKGKEIVDPTHERTATETRQDVKAASRRREPRGSRSEEAHDPVEDPREPPDTQRTKDGTGESVASSSESETQDATDYHSDEGVSENDAGLAERERERRDAEYDEDELDDETVDRESGFSEAYDVEAQPDLRPVCRHHELGTCNRPKHLRYYRHILPDDGLPLLTMHDDRTPRRNTLYFDPPPPSRDAPRIAVAIACYNEEWDELARTLYSLSRQRPPWVVPESEPRSYDHRIALIFDGIERMRPSMKKYLCEMFAGPELEQLLLSSRRRTCDADKLLAALRGPAGSSAGPRHATFIVQNRVIRLGADSEGRATFKVVHPSERLATDLNVSLVLKLDNRQKHNSHEWAFRAFARDIDAHYVFAGDVGTLYHEECLYHLARYLDTHSNVSAVTGRQRVMTAAQQKSDEWRFSLARLFRQAQRHDYEGSFASFMAAFHLAGMLPVIPGPCGMQRYSDMKGKAWEWYFRIVHTPPDEQDLIMANLLLAEDRVLCYAAATMTEEPRYTALEPKATFYFCAETDLKTLVAQRRRWINGTVAGYIWLICYRPDIIWNSGHTFGRKLFMFLLMLCQLLMFAVVAVSPGLFLISLRLSLEIIWPLTDASSSIYTDIIWGIALMSYLVFVIRHRYTNFEAVLFYWMLFLNAATITLIVATTILSVAQSGIPDFWADPMGTRAMMYYLVMLVIFCTFFPLFISLFTGGMSFYWMVMSIVPFYLFLPTLVATFGAYAFARTFDISWGNRPPSELKDVDHADPEKRAAVEKAQVKLREQSQAACGFIVMINLLIILLTLMSINLLGVMLVIGSFVFVFSVIQMLISFVWFAYFFACWLAQKVWLGILVVVRCQWAACLFCSRDREGKRIWHSDFVWQVGDGRYVDV